MTPSIRLDGTAANPTQRSRRSGVTSGGGGAVGLRAGSATVSGAALRARELLRPVRTAEEKRTVEQKATEVAGSGNVANEVTVKPAKSKTRTRTE